MSRRPVTAPGAPPPQLQLLSSSSLAALRSELAKARASAKYEAEQAAQHRPSTYHNIHVQQFRRVMHEQSERRVNEKLARDARVQRQQVHRRSEWEADLARWRMRKVAVGALHSLSRQPFPIWRGQGLDPKQFASTNRHRPQSSSLRPRSPDEMAGLLRPSFKVAGRDADGNKADPRALWWV